MTPKLHRFFFVGTGSYVVHNTEESGYNEQKTFQGLGLISADFHSYREGEHSNTISYLTNNDLEHSLRSLGI